MNSIAGLTMRNLFKFASVKKTKMQLTIRTPYATLMQNFDGFSRVLCKTSQAMLIVQNKSPPAIHVLPPGNLKVKLNSQLKTTAGDIMHSGGWLVIFSDNTCQISLLDAFQKKDLKADQMDKNQIKDLDTISGKYTAKFRKVITKSFIKKSAQ